ncbi:MAG: hypothetical protein N2Z76_05590 [Treponemataceae bacterium]|nr:hypothetical protein [Treponemataceae bacterium]
MSRKKISLFLCFLVLGIKGFLWGGESFEEATPSTLKSTSVELQIGTKAIFQPVRTTGLLNPDNSIGEPWAKGYLFQDFSLDGTFGEYLRFALNSRSKWFFWSSSTDFSSSGYRWYGTQNTEFFSIESWEIEYVSSDALISFGIGKIPWLPGPAKQLKAANYFDWMFGDYRKTLVWMGLTYDWGALKAVWGPRENWLPDSFTSTTKDVLPGASLVYGQGQFFVGPFDSGFFLAWDKDITVGWWGSYTVTPNVLWYTEGSYTTKAWLPRINATTFQVDMTRRDGIRAMTGILYSPHFPDISLYIEILYNGDGYTEKEWEHLKLRFEQAHNPALRLSFLEYLRWNTMNLWYGAVHLRPNALLFDMIEWNYSFRYSLAQEIYSRLFLKWIFTDTVYGTFLWEVPWFWGNSTIAAGETLCFPYQQRFEFSFVWIPE